MKKNRLQHETSPYLKQHENNPVDWFPWGEEALKKAKDEDKPILLSIGYSACHWCHVMAHESFEHEGIAKLMNEHFINIKVDREERPDLDQIYQPVAQMIMSGGGWPLTVFLTPDLKPYYGGTYFPPTDQHGRPGFPKLLTALSDGYQKNREEVLGRADQITELIQQADEFSGGENLADPKTRETLRFDPEFAKTALKGALDKLLAMVDWEQGGVGDAPKFPNVMVLQFLWRMSQMQWVLPIHQKSARDAIHLTLRKMACGGIFDQVGGGFHRYSVDENWLVPHFEKMLYDNALLLKLYSEVLLNDAELDEPHRALFLDTIQKTVQYVEREMTSKDGLFYAAQDADSEGVEGKFFVWDSKELSEILTPEEYSLFCMTFEVTDDGNFEHGKTILARQTLSALHGTEITNHPSFKSAMNKVFEAREKREKPGLDSKVLVSWNGLMISGLSWATLAFEKFGNFEWADRTRLLATKAYAQVKEIASQTGGGLTSTIQEGQAKGSGYLDDYAFLAQSAFDLGRVNSVARGEYLKDIHGWLNKLWADFKDRKDLGFYFTHGHHEDLIHRPKSFFDQAIPSGNGVAFQVFSVLQQMQTNPVYSQVEFELSVILRSMDQHPYGMAEFLNTLLLNTVGPVTVQGESTQAASSPYAFFESAEASSSDGVSSKEAVQFCYRQTCVLSEFDWNQLFN